MLGVYQDHGIRFEYPPDWELEVADDGPRTTVTVQAPGGLMFTLVTIDDTRPPPADLADEVLEAMRDEYPELDAVPAIESIAGHRAIGHDIEFFSLDVVNSSTIRCYRSPSRTVLVFDQWSDLAGDDPEGTVRAVRNSLEEVEEA